MNPPILPDMGEPRPVPCPCASPGALRLMLVLLLLPGCGSTIPDPGDGREGLKQAPTTIRFDALELSLETYLWRDFMPGVEGSNGGSGIQAVVRVIIADSTAVPPGTEVEQMWVVYGEEVWSSGLTAEERPGSPPWVLERIARNGPAWPAEIRVDVVARVRTPDGTTHLIQARNQRVHAVY